MYIYILYTYMSSFCATRPLEKFISQTHDASEDKLRPRGRTCHVFEKQTWVCLKWGDRCNPEMAMITITIGVYRENED